MQTYVLALAGKVWLVQAHQQTGGGMKDHFIQRVDLIVLCAFKDWHVAALFTSIANMSGNSEDWCQCNADQFEKDLFLTRRRLERSRKHLVDHGYIETKRAGIPARSWYRLTPKGVALALSTKEAA